MIEFLKPAMNWLHFHPYIAYIVTFFIAFSESIAIIGLVIPGSLILIAIGTLIGSGIVNPTETIIAAIIGAICGDFISFWIGHHYSKHLHRMWPFKRWPQLLAKGEAFFKKHGGKGVFLGRFVGPIRPITPIVAGMMKMPLFIFSIVDISSAILWAIAYMLPGIILGGAASSELSSEAAPHLILSIFIGILIFALLYWLVERIARYVFRLYAHIEHRTWKIIQSTRSLSLVKKFIYTPSLIERDHQVDLLFLFLFSSVTFLFISYEVFTHSVWLTHNNLAINHFFRSLRTVIVDHVMIPFTFLGEKYPMGILVCAVGATLLLQKHFRSAFYWFLNGFLIFASLGFVKNLLHVHRPLGTQGALTHGWSFPSGHSGLSIAILGFLGILISHRLPRFARKYVYVATFSIALLIALSRLYLGVHWFTDVFAAMCLGLACMSFTAILFRHQRNPLSLRHSVTVGIVALFAWLGSASILFYDTEKSAYEGYQLTWPEKSMKFSQWWEQNGDVSSPLYRSNRFGKPIQTLNIQFIGNLDTLRSQLLKKDWLPLNDNALKTLFYKLSDPHDSAARLPVITQQYLTRAPLLSLYKVTDEDQLVILRLWETNITIEPHDLTLLAGEINYHHTWHPKLLHKKQAINTDLMPVLTLLSNDIKSWIPSYNMKMANYKEYPPLNDGIDQDWNGFVLLVKQMSTR